MEKNSNVVLGFNGEILTEGANGLTVYVKSGVIGKISEGSVQFNIHANEEFTFTINEQNKIIFADGSPCFGNLKAYLLEDSEETGAYISVDMYFITEEYDLYSFLLGSKQREAVKPAPLPEVVYDAFHDGKYIGPGGMISSKDTMHYKFSDDYKSSWEALMDANTANVILTEGNIQRINDEIDRLLDMREFDKIPALVKQRDILTLG